MKNRLALHFYLIGVVQLALLLAPAILFSGPPPSSGRPPAPGGVPPPVLNFLCGFVVIAVGSILTGRWIATPLSKLADAAGRLARGDLRARVGFRRDDELGVVGAAFDEMAARLQDLVRAEKELVANVSHELRTPLARIRVALTLATEGDAAMSRSALAEIGTDVAELAVLVDRIITSTRVAIGKDEPVTPSKLAVRLETTSPKGVAERAAERLRSHRPGRPLVVSIDPDLPEIQVDPVLMSRALGNLLENADKYSDDESSPIDLTVTTLGDDVVFEVADRGVGIAEGDLPNLFVPFFRGAQGRESAPPGVGLGLALVKQIVDAHDGRIEVTSKKDEGTTMRLFVPRQS